MKHSVTVTSALVLIFIITQLIGLGLLATSLSVSESDEGISAEFDETLLGPRPDTSALETVGVLLLGIGLGTGLLLLLIKFRKVQVWRVWFFFAVGVAVSVSLSVVLEQSWLAWLIGFVLAAWKIFRPNVFVHNVTEILTYSAIGLIFVPLLHGEILWAILLLIAISLYDMYAVWKSKHMVKMAQFQTESKVFAGLFIPYKKTKGIPSLKSSSKESAGGAHHAILGGGDIAFPLIFIGAVFEYLIINGVSIFSAYWFASIIILTSAGALLGLFMLATKDRFYPAMPFITTGCLVGLGIVWLII